MENLDSRERFLKALLREIDLRADQLVPDPDAPTSYSTIFFGGGTPSLLSPEQLGGIMESLHRRFAIEPDAEVTMECNPGALTEGWLADYRALGVNRLSFGVQSFHDDDLQFLSRIHTATEARRGITAAMRVFDNVSLDLIFALPGQTTERWQSNLREGVALGTEHISAYALIFEEGTPLNAMRLSGSVFPASDDLDAEMYAETMETLAEHGFSQYEVSNYAKPGRECRHNLGYWERQTYISFGPSAHSFLRGANQQERWANVSSLTAYLQQVEGGTLPVASRELLSSQLVLEETVMLGLRSRGINRHGFRQVAGCDLTEYAPKTVAMLTTQGYATLSENLLSMTPKGYPFADRFAVELLVGRH